MRPIYLKRDYGKLLKEKVYVRRGSSTDPTKPASIEEIAQMRFDSEQSGAELMVEFSHIERDDTLGTEIYWDAEHCEMPEDEMIPDLSPARQRGPFGIDLSGLDLTNRLNTNFFRETAYFEFFRRLFKPVRLVVKNIGPVAANNVRIEITIPTNIGVVVIDSAEIPERPERRADILSGSVMKNIRPAFNREPGEVEIVKNSQRFRIEINCEDLQPGRRVWSEIFHIGKWESGDLTFSGMVFADNLSQPKEFALKASVSVRNTSMTVDELCSLAEKIESEG